MGAVTEELSALIRAQYSNEKLSQRDLATRHGLPRWKIQRILNPNLDAEYRAKNREKCRANTSAWKARHPEYNGIRATREREKRAADPEYAALQTSKNRAWRVSNLERAMCTAARISAKQRGLEFALEPTDIVIPDTCPVYGVKLDRETLKRQDNNPSLDRVDNSKGYTPDNIRVISWGANRDKRDLSVEQLLALAEYVINHQNGGR